MRSRLMILSMLLCPMAAATAQVSIGIGLPHLSIGINLPVYPVLRPVPGYPVYYAPGINANYFFYDGLYWVYQDDNWYASEWYNGPWGIVDREAVPLFVLRVPVRYYRQPPPYFRGWRPDAPPRWGEHWGRDWEQRRNGWDKWDRKAVPPRAPLPVYQRKFSGDRYPQTTEQPSLHDRNYRYQARDPVVREQYRVQRQNTGPGASRPDRPPAPTPGRADTQPQRPGQGQRQMDTPRPQQAPERRGSPAQSQDNGRAQQPQRPQQMPGRDNRDKGNNRPDDRGPDQNR